MLKPEFLPFRSAEITVDQALIASAYIATLEINMKPFDPNGLKAEDYFMELTGEFSSMTEITQEQKGIANTIKNTMNGIAGCRNISTQELLNEILTRLS